MIAERVLRQRYDLPTLQRFWMQVMKTDNCWEWTGPYSVRGRPRFHVAPKVAITAHRFIYA